MYIWIGSTLLSARCGPQTRECIQSFHWDSWSDSVDTLTKALGAQWRQVWGPLAEKAKPYRVGQKLAGTFSELNFNLEQFSRRKNRCWSAESGPDWCVPPSLHQDDSNFRDARTVSVSYRQGDKINQVCTATWSLIAKISQLFMTRSRQKNQERVRFSIEFYDKLAIKMLEA